MHKNHYVDLIVAEAESRDGEHVAVIATDAAGTIVYWNTGAEKLYGWVSSETIGRNVTDVIVTYSAVDDGTRIMEQLRRGQSWSGSFIVRNRAGDPILAHVVDEPVSHDGEVVGIVGISQAARRSDAERMNG